MSSSLPAKVGIKKVLVFPDGLIVLAKCVAFNLLSDVALLEICGFCDPVPVCGNKELSEFSLKGGKAIPAIGVAEDVHIGEKLVCMGQPGTDDLESDTAQKTNYDILHTSVGKYQKLLEGDILDNSEIGKMQHSCWTYWGHSGAALLNSDAEVCGLHSSWDDETATRHGVHLHAIQAFIASYASIGVSGTNGSASVSVSAGAGGAVQQAAGGEEKAKRAKGKIKDIIDLT